MSDKLQFVEPRLLHILRLIVESLIDPGDFSHPLLTFQMLHFEYLVVRPVEVVCDVRYLFIEPLYGVAPDPPRLFISMSKSCSQCGHCTRTRSLPYSFIRR